MTETEIQRRKGNGSIGSWIRGVSTTAMIALLAWGGKTLWEVNATLSAVDSKITNVEAKVNDQTEDRQRAEETQWRILREHTDDVGRLKAQIETLRFVQTEIVLRELQNPIPRRITFAFSAEPKVSTVRVKPMSGAERLLRWWEGRPEAANVPVQARLDFEQLEEKLREIEQHPVYGKKEETEQPLQEFQQEQEQLQLQEQAPRFNK